MTKNILISGASVAGPALAYWLHRYGFTPTVVERAPGLRGGGFAVDFRGDVHLRVLREMGILDEVRRRQTNMGNQVVVDADGGQLAKLPASFMSGDVEIERDELSRLLHERTRDHTEYLFGDSIASMTEDADGVRVCFEHGEPRTFDLVLGADGLHSNVRALAFGPESRFIRFLGYYVAGFEMPNFLGLDHTGLMYNVPGLGVNVGSAGGKTDGGFVFPSEELDYDRRDLDAQKQLVARRCAGAGWEVPRLLEAMWAAPEMYFDSISQVRMPSFQRGRVALVGDAGYGATLGGLGTGTAMVGAYVLAGELAVAHGDHRVAFPRYEERMRGYAEGCQKLAEGAGPFLAPPTRFKIWQRNQMYKALSWRRLAGVFDKMTTKAARNITLPDYRPAPRSAVPRESA
ncbi:FAD-dependent monooxygenase [Amycolatopsis albispora]|uniref:FAD-dependent oxidoreductase n=1 Tax=Amycolatopsis albispora TaxID=1804986 RepID=A0A344L3E0_9PSEU|nr:FAD-dependent monooxygenase [Amycolatopsis albispora]AXB42564.1 FAD-dependent oxidoreductase [Amycolatopsis albispora]